MTGKEIYELKTCQKVTNEEIVVETKCIIFTCVSTLGDQIKMIFTSPNREKYAKVAQICWSKIITDYTLLPNNQVYLPPKDYWGIYKKMAGGRELIKGTGSQLFINNIPFSFVDTDYYFNASPEIDRGVYGIYYQDILIYIGSSTDVLVRWKEHDDAFRNKSSTSSMYHANYDPDLVEYRILVSQEELNNLIPTGQANMWLMELIEWSYIKILQPLYNREGKSCCFNFKAQPGDLPIDYQLLVKKFLTTEFCPPTIEEQLRENL